MVTSLSIRLKAAFLLAVFSLNIAVGFACSVGIDMGFNKHHHDKDMVMSEGSHHHDMQAQNSSHHRDELTNKTSKGDDDNCCKDKVTKLATADKSLPQAYNAINPVFFTSFISTFYEVDIFHVQPENSSIKYFVRSSPPTISDIRIAIQSFLI